MSFTSIPCASAQAHTSHRRLWVATVAALSAFTTHAQTRTEPVVVTAARTSERVAETLRDVTVLRGDDLVAQGVNELEAALRSVPGFQVQSLGAGATPSIFVRGGNSNQVLVLVDGQRIGSSFSGLSALQHIPITQIDRIEIVRGPAASLYGADAVSGVVQIFTKQSAGLEAHAALGNLRSSDVSARAGFAQGNHRVSIAANHRESRGFNAIIDPANFSFNPDRDGYRFSSVTVNAAHQFTRAFSLEGNALVARGNAQYDGDATFDDRIKSNLHHVGAKAIYAPSDRLQSTLSLGQGVDKSEFVSSFPGNYQTTNDQASWQNNFRLDRNTTLWNAIEWRREKIDTDQGFATDSRRTASAAFGAETSFDALKVAASIRVDDSNQYDTTTTGNFGLAYTLAREWRMLVNAGTSFKAPTFNDLYFPGFSNPNLSPEKGRNIEAALQWSRGTSNAALVVYENRVRDLIQFQCDANFNCAPQNVAKANLRGATLSAATQLAKWKIETSIDIADPEDANTAKRLPRRAKLHGAFKASGNVFGVNTGVEVVASGDRFDNASNTRRLAGYGIVNAFARYEVMRGVRVGLRVDNAFDRAYENSRGYSTGGRRAWITLDIISQ
jgi:vitamin B12 transporter